MLLLWISLFLYIIHAQADFGRSYLGNSRLCHEWNCINEKLNLSDTLPPKYEYLNTIRSLLPEEWKKVGDEAVEACYGNRTRKYINTCPGQALTHCLVDQLTRILDQLGSYIIMGCLEEIAESDKTAHCVLTLRYNRCPESSQLKNDGCAPVLSIGGTKYMFSQSRYNNVETSSPTERRPMWFIRKYFNIPCCDLPEIFSDGLLTECGFSKFMHYYVHTTQTDVQFRHALFNLDTQIRNSNSDHHKDVYITNKKEVHNVISTSETIEPLLIEDPLVYEQLDPLDCCNLGGFIEHQWRSDCQFQTSWDDNNRLTIMNTSPVVTSTEKPEQIMGNDVKMLPLSCEKETCIFQKLNVVKDNGEIDRESFIKLLDNMTESHPEWTSAKGRVITHCLRTSRQDTSECQLNGLLECVFDVLTDKCPHAKKDEPCKQRNKENLNITCQISTAQYSPKNRRELCTIPDLVSPDILSQCNATSIYQLESVPHVVKRKKSKWEILRVNCQELTPPTTCILNKMGVLNKYGFVDYFKMKQKIRDYSQTPLYELYFSVFLALPLYDGQCSSSKKLLNLVDFMLTTCPESKRTDTQQCSKLLLDINRSLPANVPTAKLEEVFKNIQQSVLQTTTQRILLKTYPLFDFGVLNSHDSPTVKLIDVKPREKTLVVLPVYQRMNKSTGFPIYSLHNDGVLRS